MAMYDSRHRGTVSRRFGANRWRVVPIEAAYADWWSLVTAKSSG